MKRLNQKKKQLKITPALHNFAVSLAYSSHQLDNTLDHFHNETILNSILFIELILRELFDRNFDKKTRKHDSSFAKPLLLPLSPNCYAPNNKQFWESLKDFSLTQVKLSLKILQKFNIIKVQKGFWKKQEIILWNEKTQQHDHFDLIDTEVTQVFLNPIITWNKHLILNFQKNNQPYTWLDLVYAFTPKVFSKRWTAVFRSKIKDDKDEVIQQTDAKAPVELCEQVELINESIKKAGYPNFQYKRIYGETGYQYGRFYSHFQNIPKEIRKLICEEQGWVEFDYSASNPNLIWLIETGTEFNGDIYNFICEKLKMPLEFRPIVKKIMLYLFASSSREGKHGAEISIRKVLSENGLYINNTFTEPVLIEDVKEYLDSLSLEKEKNYFDIKKYCFKNFLIENNLSLDTPHYLYSVSYIIETIQQIPEFKNYLFSDSTSLLQQIESNICFLNMQQQLLPLSIHDSFISNNKDFYDIMKINRFIVCLKYTKNRIVLLKEIFKYIIYKKKNQTNNTSLYINKYTIMKNKDTYVANPLFFDTC